MKSLAVALGITLLFSAALFGIFRAFGVANQVAGPLASAALPFITFFHDKVDKAFSKGTSEVSPGIVPLEDFNIKWPLMLLYSSFICLAIVEVASFIYLIPIMMFPSMESSIGDNAGMLGLLGLPVTCWGLFILGRWLGVRNGRAGYWILPVAFLISRIFEVALLFVTDPSFKQTWHGLYSNKIEATAALFIGALVIGSGLLGVWRGNRVRFGAYFNSLLKQVSPATRETLLSMTFDEASASKAHHS